MPPLPLPQCCISRLGLVEHRLTCIPRPARLLLLLQNLQHGLPLGWDPSAPVKQPLAGPPAAHTLLPGGEPLRPVNQQTGHGAAAAAGGQHPPQHQQQHHDPQQQHPPELPLDAAELAAAAAAAGCGDIDWRSPEQVAHLLRILHMERLRRLGQQLPPAYRG